MSWIRRSGRYALRLVLPLVAAAAFLSGPACVICRTSPVATQIHGPASIHVGEMARLTTTSAGSDRPSNPVQPSSSSIDWTSSDRAVATVSLDGEVHGIAPGKATITATPYVSCIGPVYLIPGTLLIIVVP